jgi:ABC-type protease/lipase transport system fused ATPase/permease subunit
MNNLYAIVAGVINVVLVAAAAFVFAVDDFVFVNDPSLLVFVVVIVFVVFIVVFILNTTSYTVHAPSSGKKME